MCLHVYVLSLFSLVSLRRSLSTLLIFSKNRLFFALIFFYCLFVFNLTEFCSNFYDFLSSADFELHLFFFL